MNGPEILTHRPRARVTGLRSGWRVGLLVCLLACAPVWAVESSSSDLVLLKDGDTTGWVQSGPGQFDYDPDEQALLSNGGMGLFYYADRKFADFDLRLEWKVGEETDNSGVFVRFPNLPDDSRPPDSEGRVMGGPWAAVYEGYEVQICDADEPGRNTGSLYSFFAPSKPAPTHEPGQWNNLRIKVIGQDYMVWVNDTLIGEYRGSRALEGYIGIQNHGENDQVWFKNIRITPLTPEAEAEE